MQEILTRRTKQLSLTVIKLFVQFKKTEEGRILGRQLLRSTTSVSANYRAARRARSKAEFYSKICIVVEEIDEVTHWIELFQESNIIGTKILEPIQQEADELLRIFAKLKKSAGTSRSHNLT